MTENDLRDCQIEQIDFAAGRTKFAIFSEMGLGKTAASATVLSRRLLSVEAHRVLVIGPLSVMRKTWPDEIKNWEQTKWMTVEFLRDAVPGAAHEFLHIRRVRYWLKKKAEIEDQYKQAWDRPHDQKQLRKDMQRCDQALKYGLCSAANPADVHLINWQNVHWLVVFWGKYWPYDTVVYDESSIGLKNGKMGKKRPQVWEAMRLIMPYTERLTLLSGTPMPKGLMNLFGQIYLLDGGARLGRTITQYRQTYFNERPSGFGYDPKPGAMQQILEKISDIVLVQRACDYMDLPETIFHEIPVVLSDEHMKLYKKLQKQYLVKLLDGKEITADAAAALLQKLLQLASGRVFDENKIVHEVHSAKLDALAEYLEMRNDNVLLAYWFRPDLAAITAKFPHARVLTKKNPELQDEWNAGKVPLMILHPQSLGHGINIQYGGRRVLWFGPIFHTELYQQLNHRLAGARAVGHGTAFIDHLVSVGTADERAMKVLRADGDMQEEAMAYLKCLMVADS